MKPILRWFAVLALTSSAVFAGWPTDYPAATAAAEKGDQNTLVLFTGKDWCPPCKKLEKDTLSQKDFLAFANKNLQLVELDFPRSEEPTPANTKLASQYSVEGFPTLILLSPKGKELARNVGYLPGGPDALIAWIEKASK